MTETPYGTTLTVVRTAPARHGDRGPATEKTTDGWEIGPAGSPEDVGTTRDVTTTRLQAYGGPDDKPDIRPADRVYLAGDRRIDQRGKRIEPRWQVDGDPETWGPGETVVTLRRVTG